jgi:signal peptidase I
MEAILDKLHEHRKLIERILTIMAVLTLVLTVAVSVQDKFTFFATARGKSMHPVFANNDLIPFVPYQLVKGFRQAQVGDIIVYRAPAIPPVWAHRIIEEESPGVFRTKGDNNPRPDSFTITESAILGVVPSLGSYTPSIPAIGGLFLQWQSNQLLRWGIPLGIIVLLLALPSGNRRRVVRRISAYGWFLRRSGITLLCSLIFFTIISFPYLSKSGYTAVGYRIAEGQGIAMGGSAPISFGIIKEGDTKTEERSVGNGGIVPMVALYRVVDDPIEEVHILPPVVLLPPQTTSKIDIQVTGKEIGDWREVTLAMTLAPRLLPVSWIDSLSRIHPIVPNLVIAGAMSFAFGAVIFAIFGPLKRRHRVTSRKRQRFPVKTVAPIASGVGLLVLGFMLPGILSSTALVLDSPLEAQVTTASSETSSIAYGSLSGIGVVAGEPQSAALFWIDNNYAQAVLVEAWPVNGSGMLTDWNGQEIVPPGGSQMLWGTLNAPEAGTHYLEFQVQVFGQPGVLVASFNVPVSVEAEEPQPPPEEEDD